MASLFFRAHGISEWVRVSKIKFTTAKWPSTRIILRKEWRGVKTFMTLEFLGLSERFTLYRQDPILLGCTCYTCENTSLFSCKSRVLHTFGVCAPTGVYKMKGGPRSSHYFAFSKVLSTIYVYGDGNTTCVHTRNSIKKVLHKCYTGFWTRKLFVRLKVWLQSISTSRYFHWCFILSRRGYYGAYTNEKSKSYFHPKWYMQDSTQLEVIFSIRSRGGKYFYQINYKELGSIISGSYF